MKEWNQSVDYQFHHTLMHFIYIYYIVLSSLEEQFDQSLKTIKRTESNDIYQLIIIV
jgi:hypothetical protein